MRIRIEIVNLERKRRKNRVMSKGMSWRGILRMKLKMTTLDLTFWHGGKGEGKFGINRVGKKKIFFFYFLLGKGRI